MSKKSSSTLEFQFELRASRSLSVALTLVHALAMAALFLTDLHTVAIILGWLLCLVSVFFHLRRFVACRGDGAVCLVQLKQGGWDVMGGHGSWQHYADCEYTRLGSWLVLCWRGTGPGSRRVAVVAADAVSRDQYRRIIRALTIMNRAASKGSQAV